MKSSKWLPDDLWARIEPLLPAKKKRRPIGGQPATPAPKRRLCDIDTRPPAVQDWQERIAIDPDESRRFQTGPAQKRLGCR